MFHYPISSYRPGRLALRIRLPFLPPLVEGPLPILKLPAGTVALNPPLAVGAAGAGLVGATVAPNVLLVAPEPNIGAGVAAGCDCDPNEKPGVVVGAGVTAFADPKLVMVDPKLDVVVPPVVLPVAPKPVAGAGVVPNPPVDPKPEDGACDAWPNEKPVDGAGALEVAALEPNVVDVEGGCVDAPPNVNPPAFVGACVEPEPNENEAFV